jgi:hypothetical protein
MITVTVSVNIPSSWWNTKHSHVFFMPNVARKHSLFIFEKMWIKISAWRPTVLIQSPLVPPRKCYVSTLRHTMTNRQIDCTLVKDLRTTYLMICWAFTVVLHFSSASSPVFHLYLCQKANICHKSLIFSLCICWPCYVGPYHHRWRVLRLWMEETDISYGG